MSSIISQMVIPPPYADAAVDGSVSWTRAASSLYQLLRFFWSSHMALVLVVLLRNIT